MPQTNPLINEVRDGLIYCSRGDHWLPPEDFVLAPRMARGRHSWCRGCLAEYNQSRNSVLTAEQRAEINQRRRDNGSSADYSRRMRRDDPERARFHTIKYRYGVTREQWDARYAEQGGVCAIPGCGGEGRYVDHDHACCPPGPNMRACGRCFRGLVCARCNKTMGYTADNAKLLRAMAQYLETHQRLKDTSTN